MKLLRWLIAGICLALVAGVAHWESRQLISPGELHPSHADIAELQGDRGCAACHGEASMAESCSTCHAAVSRQIRDGLGIHGRLDPSMADDCDACHREHTGGAIGLVADLSFQAAGLGDMRGFDHARVVHFGLEGRHDALSCGACHAQAEAPRLKPGQQRFLGLSQSCTACHEDAHDGFLGDDCASCHGQEHAFPVAPGFVHDEAFPLRGGHAAVACRACHEATGPDLVASLRSEGVASRACAGCHRSPHGEGFLRAVAAARRTTPRTTCTVCHQAAHEHFLGPAAGMPFNLHAATGFPLDPPHDQQTCDQCHPEYGRRNPLPDGPDLAERFVSFFPGRTPAECRACHGDPHAGQFDAGPTGGRCGACHASAHFLPSTFDVADHARTGFPLTGAHEAIACNNCHGMEGDLRRFVPTPSACAECHEDPHGGRFDGLRVFATGGEGCARCHTTSSFDDVAWSSLAHRQASGYPLNGAHARVACMSCHQRQGGPGDFGLDAPSRQCASCHVDPHAGQFRRAGSTSCARCHGETDSFSEIHFDHQHDSRFALDEQHATLACAACHRAYPIQGGGFVVRYRPLGTECRDCHGSARPVPHAR